MSRGGSPRCACAPASGGRAPARGRGRQQPARARRADCCTTLARGTARQPPLLPPAGRRSSRAVALYLFRLQPGVVL
eukprot:741146-Pyramimonas_sp.AAC.1